MNYEPKFEGRLFWISEPDTGLYDAMNKGIKLVKDDNSYIMFLNSDDYLYSHTTIKEIVRECNNNDLDNT